MSLKDKRKEKHLTQKEAATIFDLKYRTYQNYENGVTTPIMEKAAEMAKYFSCSISDLFDLEDGIEKCFSDDELEIISAYRKMSEENKKQLSKIIYAFVYLRD